MFSQIGTESVARLESDRNAAEEDALVVEEQQWKDIQDSRLFDGMPSRSDNHEKLPIPSMNESDHLRIATAKERL